MTAKEVKEALYIRHFAGRSPMPGAWTCIEEWRGIDFLAWSSWSSASQFGRIGYEVKVSRQDLRNELLKPGKRLGNVEWCHEFYLAVPKGLLKPEEIEWVEPEWEPTDFVGSPCPGFLGEQCRRNYSGKTHRVFAPVPYVGSRADYLYGHRQLIKCPTCNGKGVTMQSRVEREAPTCWVPRDIGLVVIDGRGCTTVKRSPRRKEVPAMSDRELGQLVRWVSIRPDPRHQVRPSVMTMPGIDPGEYERLARMESA